MIIIVFMNILNLNNNGVVCISFSLLLILVNNLYFQHLSCSCSLHASRARPRGCRGPASRLSASQPFPQFARAAGFTGFTLTPLTPRPRPPTATHPASDQWRRGHVLITHRLAWDWPGPATPLPVIGCVLPPARLLWILFLCFFLFFFHSAEAVCWQRLSPLLTAHTPPRLCCRRRRLRDSPSAQLRDGAPVRWVFCTRGDTGAV